MYESKYKLLRTFKDRIIAKRKIWPINLLKQTNPYPYYPNKQPSIDCVHKIKYDMNVKQYTYFQKHIHFSKILGSTGWDATILIILLEWKILTVLDILSTINKISREEGKKNSFSGKIYNPFSSIFKTTCMYWKYSIQGEYYVWIELLSSKRCTF